MSRPQEETSTDHSRFIRLRRPPILQILEGPFVPATDAATRDAIEWRWTSLCKANPAYFDGRLYHVLGAHRNGYGGAVLHVADCAYRYHAVQDETFDLGVRPLGAKGIVQHQGNVLLGRRAATVASYAGQWEFAPGGVVDPGHTPAETIGHELREETGLTVAAPPVAIALLFDAALRTWEVVYRLSVTERSGEPETAEYDELRWCAPGTWPEGLTPVAQEMVRRGLA